MSDSEASRLDLTQVIDRFPDRGALIEKLAADSETFRGLCEDLTLASSTLARLSALEDTERNVALMSDYRLLVADLEHEIAAALEVVRDDD